jgi:hypothetical protein
MGVEYSVSPLCVKLFCQQRMIGQEFAHLSVYMLVVLSVSK